MLMLTLYAMLNLMVNWWLLTHLCFFSQCGHLAQRSSLGENIINSINLKYIFIGFQNQNIFKKSHLLGGLWTVSPHLLLAACSARRMFSTPYKGSLHRLCSKSAPTPFTGPYSELTPISGVSVCEVKTMQGPLTYPTMHLEMKCTTRLLAALFNIYCMLFLSILCQTCRWIDEIMYRIMNW